MFIQLIFLNSRCKSIIWYWLFHVNFLISLTRSLSLFSTSPPLPCQWNLSRGMVRNDCSLQLIFYIYQESTPILLQTYHLSPPPHRNWQNLSLFNPPILQSSLLISVKTSSNDFTPNKFPRFHFDYSYFQIYPFLVYPHTCFRHTTLLPYYPPFCWINTLHPA